MTKEELLIYAQIEAYRIEALAMEADNQLSIETGRGIRYDYDQFMSLSDAINDLIANLINEN